VSLICEVSKPISFFWFSSEHWGQLSGSPLLDYARLADFLVLGLRTGTGRSDEKLLKEQRFHEVMGYHRQCLLYSINKGGEYRHKRGQITKLVVLAM
jgi:hypothetical protein